MSEPFILLPAVDIRHGQAVQLVRGAPDSAKQFGDPVAAALRWQRAGAQWLHLVNLDGAFGDSDSWDVVRAVIAAVNMQVEVSGGIRDDATLEAALATGCARVNIGTAAIENPKWTQAMIARYAERIALAIDVKDARVVGRGWVTQGPAALEVISSFSTFGCARFVITDVASDGTLAGPNLTLLREVCAVTDAKVIASGGIASLADIAALALLRPCGIEGAVIGTALYLGYIDLSEALALEET
ncbi:MAG: tRNA-dihydrouridine synthase [Propionibacteriaceae bacterium]|nr:tRNA-dihydrouridine synthase [Propionibacteriaceae bacterium]